MLHNFLLKKGYVRPRMGPEQAFRRAQGMLVILLLMISEP
jgi:hypothetical protein